MIREAEEFADEDKKAETCADRWRRGGWAHWWDGWMWEVWARFHFV